jgi:hypothetical protein
MTQAERALWASPMRAQGERADGKAPSAGGDRADARSFGGRFPPPLAPPAAAVTDLTFTGSLAARAQSATSSGPCGRAPAGFGAELRFSMSSQQYLLSIAILDYHGPGSYAIPPERVSVSSGQGPGGQFLPAIKGSLTVDPGERSGRIDAAIGDGSANVTGTWTCT